MPAAKNSDKTPEKPTCFIAMPVSNQPEHTEKYGDEEHWKHVMETLFMPAIEKAGFEPVIPVARGSYLIHDMIVKNLSDCDMVLVDLSTHNPNVFFEMGVRTSLDKPIALTFDGNDRLPFDTAGINTHKYDPRLNGWLMADEVDRLAEHIKDSRKACDGKNPLWQRFGLAFAASAPSSNESPEDAKIDLIVQMVEDLRTQQAQLADRVRGASTSYRAPSSIRPKASTEPSVAETRKLLSALAGKRTMVEVEPIADGGVRVVLLGDRPDKFFFEQAEKLYERLGITSVVFDHIATTSGN